MSRQKRREFLGKVAFGIAGASVGPAIIRKSFAAGGDMPYRTLGRTGEKVSLLGLGGYHIGTQRDEQESIRIVHAAIDSGINFLDNCWDYHDGVSEVRMGKALQGGYRKKIFLMTKTDGQLKDICARQLDECLRRLQVDMIDLVQFHELVRMGDPDRIFGPNGAVEALVAARKAGKIRYIGFTGHKDPDIHLKMLRIASAHGFRFDTVQMPLNLLDAHYHSFAKKVVPVLAEQGIGVLGMKPMASGIIPTEKFAAATECLHYAMNLPTSVVINGCDSLERLKQGIEAAQTFRPLEAAELSALLAKTAKFAVDGKYEPFKTTVQFDSTTANPQWLG